MVQNFADVSALTKIQGEGGEAGYVLCFDAALLSPKDFRLATVTLTPETRRRRWYANFLEILVARLSTNKQIQLILVGVGKPDLSDD